MEYVGAMSVDLLQRAVKIKKYSFLYRKGF